MTPGQYFFARFSFIIYSPPSAEPHLLLIAETENQTAKINEIIAVRIGNTSQRDGNDGKFRNLELVSMTPTMFSIWVVNRTSKHRWRSRKVTFQSKDTSVIRQWVDKIQDILNKPGMTLQ